jgi:hypothetical protein
VASKPEKVEEKKFVVKVKSHNWICFKLATQGSYGETGYNDRAVWADYGVQVVFEFKRIGEEARKLQDYRHKEFKRLGHKSHVVFTCAEAYRILLALVEAAKEAHEVSEAAG